MDELQKLNHAILTENGDKAFDSIGHPMLDLLFMSSYYEKHLEEVCFSDSPKEKLFAMFMRDPRHGLGRRDLGRKLMEQSKLSPSQVVLAGRYDDLLFTNIENGADFWFSEIKKGQVLAKKWAPRLTGKYRNYAKYLCSVWGISEKEYRSLIRCEDTVEYKLSYAEKDKENGLESLWDTNKTSHPLVNTIDFSQVPSLAMIKYYNRFLNGEDTKERFQAYLEEVKNGNQELKVSTTTVYDLYQNKDKIDADLFFSQLEKISVSCLPIIDSSASMLDIYDSFGKALSIGHYLAHCSTYAKGWALTFSREPRLLQVKGDSYREQIQSLITGEAENTDLGQVMKFLQKQNGKVPDYLVVLSDMQFDEGSNDEKEALMTSWKAQGIHTKIVWWNFGVKAKMTPETDEYGNIFLSGYSPMLLKYLEAGFNGKAFLDRLLVEYSKKIM